MELGEQLFLIHDRGYGSLAEYFSFVHLLERVGPLFLLLLDFPYLNISYLRFRFGIAGEE